MTPQPAPFYYLATPYNGTPEQMQDRVEKNLDVTAAFYDAGIRVFSPIVHSHQVLAKMQDSTVEVRRDLFLQFDLSIISASNGIIVLQLPGWEKSFGVREEIQFCDLHDIPVVRFDYEEVISSPKLAQEFTERLKSLNTLSQAS